MNFLNSYEYITEKMCYLDMNYYRSLFHENVDPVFVVMLGVSFKHPFPKSRNRNHSSNINLKNKNLDNTFAVLLKKEIA